MEKLKGKVFLIFMSLAYLSRTVVETIWRKTTLVNMSTYLSLILKFYVYKTPVLIRCSLKLLIRNKIIIN